MKQCATNRRGKGKQTKKRVQQCAVVVTLHPDLANPHHILSDVGKRGNGGDVVSVRAVLILQQNTSGIVLLERGRRVLKNGS